MNVTFRLKGTAALKLRYMPGLKGDKGDTGDVTPAALQALTDAEAAAAAALVSQAAAAGSAAAAAGSATAAGLSATNAATSATSAGSSATAAAGSSSAAGLSAGNAATSATNAASSAAAAASAYDAFDDRWLGPKPSDPSTDNDGNPLLTGAVYFNTGVLTPGWRAYSGTAWQSMVVASLPNAAAAVSFTPTGGVAATTVQAAIAELDGELIRKDGSTTITADIPFNNKKLTGVADAVADTDGMNRRTVDTRTGLVMLSKQTVSGAVSAVDFTLPPGYARFNFEFEGVRGSVDSLLAARISTDNGATYLSSNEYRTENMLADDTTPVASNVVQGFAGISTGVDMDNTLYSILGDGSINQYISGQRPIVLSKVGNFSVSTTSMRAAVCATAINIAATLTNLRFMMNTGNITAGTFRLWGVKS